MASNWCARAVSMSVLQGHTVDVDTALVTTSEVTDYHMILLLGIGETRHCSCSVSRPLQAATACCTCLA
jgi:hypothetical protein